MPSNCQLDTVDRDQSILIAPKLTTNLTDRDRYRNTHQHGKKKSHSSNPPRKHCNMSPRITSDRGRMPKARMAHHAKLLERVRQA